MPVRLRKVSLPVALLAVVSVLSLGARVAWLGEPCHARCTSSQDHLLIFDEVYYVNAARVIAGINPPAGQHYFGAPLGDDPNSEHPQLVKLVIAAGIELFGDGPLAWRLGSLIAGSLAILGMWALARAGGAGEWLALIAAALMSADNLLLVAGRIGTLDIYAAAAMVWAVALYLRGHPLIAGVVLGIGTACKELAPYALLVVVLFELFTALAVRPSRRALAATAARLVAFAAVTTGVFVGLLALMDRIAPPYDPQTGELVPGGLLGHIEHIISYASHLSSKHGLHGIASYPWMWLFDYKPIVYLSIHPAANTPGFVGDHPEVFFLGMISPPIMLLALPAMILAAVWVWRSWRRSWGRVSGPAAASAALPGAGLSPVQSADPAFAIGSSGALGLAWFLATFLPYELMSVVWQRTSYLYYMVIVTPGIYLAVAALVIRYRRRRWLVGIWGAAVLAAAVIMYPFVPLF